MKAISFGLGPIILRTALGVGLMAYLTLSGTIDWSALLLLVMDWRSSGLALALLLLVGVLVSVRLTILVGALGLRMPVLTAFRLALIGGFFSTFLPGAVGGDLARMYLAARTNPGRATELVTVIAVDRLVGLMSLLALPVLITSVLGFSVAAEGRTIVEGLFWIAVLGLLVGFVVVVACWLPPLRAGIASLLGSSRLAPHAQRLFATIDCFRDSKRRLLGAFVLSLLIQVVAVAAIVVLVQTTGGSRFTWPMALVIPFGQMANAIPVTPGGVGIGESAFTALFAAIGAAGGAEAILAWRVLTTLIDLAGGAILIAGKVDVRLAEAS